MLWNVRKLQPADWRHEEHHPSRFVIALGFLSVAAEPRPWTNKPV
jgi:hypothetical protein